MEENQKTIILTSSSFFAY